MQVITFNDVNMTINGESIFKHLNLEINNGELVIFVGASGSGKTTLLDLCAQLRVPTRGEINSQFAKSKIAYMRQTPTTSTGLTTFQFIAKKLLANKNWMRRLLNKPSFSDHVRIMDYLEKVSLLSLKHQKLDKLSGGERRRIELASTIIQECELYLFDEPIAGLDQKTAIQIMNEIKELLHEQGKTIIITMSQVDIARNYASQLFISENGTWKI
jgi:ABC-type phosphate/phosphonate transport system ATPase subunit